MEEYKNKKLAGIRFLGITIGIIIVMGFIAALNGSTTENVYTSNPPTKITNVNGATSYEMVSGTYIAGKDFNEGTYNIIATEGKGNVSSSNMYTGGMDGELSSDGNGAYKEYKDISLPSNTKLTISGDLKIELIKVS